MMPTTFGDSTSRRSNRARALSVAFNGNAGSRRPESANANNSRAVWPLPSRKRSKLAGLRRSWSLAPARSSSDESARARPGSRRILWTYPHGMPFLPGGLTTAMPIAPAARRPAQRTSFDCACARSAGGSVSGPLRT